MPKGTPRECKRCGYVWTQRLEDDPKRCANPSCRSVYWDTEYRHPVEEERVEGTGE